MVLNSLKGVSFVLDRDRKRFQVQEGPRGGLYVLIPWKHLPILRNGDSWFVVINSTMFHGRFRVKSGRRVI